MNDSNKTFLSLAFSSHVFVPALKVALVVGTVLAFINHSEAIFMMQIDSERLAKIVFTFIVPYCVSTYSSVKAIKSYE